MKKDLIILFSVLSFLITSCVTDPNTGNQKLSKTASYGLGAAATCGIIGAATKNSKRARNAALGCAAIGSGVGAYMDYQEKILRDKLKDTPIDVSREGDNIKLIMPDNITFEINSYQLSPYVKDILNEVGKILAKYDDTKINIIGHTDSTGKYSINMPLSNNRAHVVYSYLISNCGINSLRLNYYGVGASQPKADNKTAAGRAQNRRVEILIVPNV